MADYYLDSVVNGAGPGNRGADYAMFRREYAGIQAPNAIGTGEFKISTIDWIKRGRPTRIEVFLGPDDLPGVSS